MLPLQPGGLVISPLVSSRSNPKRKRRTWWGVKTWSVVAVAQLVEHGIVIPRVAGSSPVGHPNFFYRAMKFQIKLRKGKKRANVIRMPLAKPTKPNQVWSMDFIFDRMENGRTLKVFNVVDDFSKICIGQIVDSSITGKRLVNFFSKLEEKPTWLRCDNGPEFWSRAFQQWAYENVKIDFIDPGKPTQNAFVESFNGKFRSECLNENMFFSLNHARELIDEWRIEYNEVRPHRTLKGKSPKEFAREELIKYQQQTERLSLVTS
jgi:putative transposase